MYTQLQQVLILWGFFLLNILNICPVSHEKAEKPVDFCGGVAAY